MYSLKPDYEKSKRRIEAFWQRELLDRPVVQFKLFKPKNELKVSPIFGNAPTQFTDLDAEYLAERHLADLNTQLFLGDSLPVAYPDLGPEVMAAFYGCPYMNDENGIWRCKPLAGDIDLHADLSFNWQSPWLVTLHKLTKALLEIGNGRFITGIGNWVTGSDCLAAILGPMRLGATLIDHPNMVKKQLDIIGTNFERLYTEFYERLREAGQPATTWIPLVSGGKYYVIGNDFSALVSTRMFREFFLNDVIRESKFLDHSIYHLDGPDALKHLDAILEIDDLDGIQFVPPPGDNGFANWMQVYKRIQKAGKCLQLNCDISEVADISRNLEPEGLVLYVQNVSNKDEAEALIHFLEQWSVSPRHSA